MALAIETIYLIKLTHILSWHYMKVKNKTLSLNRKAESASSLNSKGRVVRKKSIPQNCYL